jgi:hypothetical protein
MSHAAYVVGVIELYRRFAGGHIRPRRADRELAAAWHRAGFSRDTIECAMLLAFARRLARPPNAVPLQPIRSLHYFIPVLDEVASQPLAEHYVAYLRRQGDGGPAIRPTGARPDFDDSR